MCPRVIVDAGANIGLTSIFYANKYPSANIIAIEPESSNFALLQKNTQQYPNITAVHAALWKENSQISVIDPGQGHYGFQTVEQKNAKYKAGNRNLVAAVTVDYLMSHYALNLVDILKIDIEASEKEVFEDSTAWIDRVGIVVVELHDHFRAGCARSVYLATKDFEYEWRKGETVFLARKEYAGNVASLKPGFTGEKANGRNNVRDKARILQRISHQG
jgi:FkbM family methyltransferase